jgi:hypothetical protein
MYAYVGMFHGGEWALVDGTSIVEAVIESAKSIAIVMAAVLFLESPLSLFDIFLSPIRKLHQALSFKTL